MKREGVSVIGRVGWWRGRMNWATILACGSLLVPRPVRMSYGLTRGKSEVLRRESADWANLRDCHQDRLSQPLVERQSVVPVQLTARTGAIAVEELLRFVLTFHIVPLTTPRQP